MDRLTLPREQKTVDAGKCLPAGDSLPSWSSLPLDAKFPMVPTPKGTLTMFTTKFGSPKYRRKSSSEFDLTDPNGMSMSSEYHPLHDPHLRTHFSVPCMRRHLVRSGFINDEGMVICNLKEFNKYRQYLRRICLMELMRERKKEALKGQDSSVQQGLEGTGTDEEGQGGSLSTRFMEVRRRQIEKLEKQKLKMLMMAKMKGEQMERKKQEQMERQAESIRRRQAEEDRRRDTLMRNAEEMERRNLSLLRKWRRRDRQHYIRLEDMRRRRALDLERKNKDSWETRKRVQQERLEREAGARERLKESQERDIANRETWLKRQRDGQIAKLNQLKSSARRAQEERERICGARLASRITAIRQERRRRDTQSPFQSEWTLQQVLRRLSFPDVSFGSSHELIQMLSDAIDEAVDRVTSHSDVDVTSDTDEEKEMKRFAADIVESVVTKVKEEIYPAYLRLLGTRENGSGEEDFYEEDMDEQAEYERSDNATDEELNFSPTSDENPPEAKDSRSVRFSFDEAIIPVSMDSLDVLSGGLKPVSEHTLTPVPSPIPHEGSGSDFDFRVKGPGKPTKRESSLVESLLLRLLDDLNSGRLKRDDLLKLTGYCVEVITAKDKDARKDQRVCESPSGQVADDLVKFTLSKILDDIKSGSVNHEDLTALTRSIIKDAQNESGIEPDLDEEALDRFISSALSGAADDENDEHDDQMNEWMLEDFMAKTLSQVKNDIDENKLSEEELQAMGAAVARAVISEVEADESLLAEEMTKKCLNNVLDGLEAGKAITVVMDKVISAIVTSYHTMTGKDERTGSEVIEEFVTAVLTQVVEGIKAGDYAEDELRQIIDSKKSMLTSKTDSSLGEGKGVKLKVQSVLDSLLCQLESGMFTESEMMDMGSVLVETGNKLLAARGIKSSSTESIQPHEMTSTEVAERVVKEVIENIQGEMEDETFEKEALKALAASFLKVSSTSFEDFSNAPTVGSSRDLSHFSTLKATSPTESTLAADVVLVAMEKITRDIAERNIPVHMLSSIAFSLTPENEDTPSILVSDNEIGNSALPENVKSTLVDIIRLLREDRVGYEDAKRVFSIILQSYLCGDTERREASSVSISDDDSIMIEELISETIRSVVRNVTTDVSSTRVTVGSKRSGMSISKLSSVVSSEDLERLVWDTLHRIGQDVSMESVVSRPPAPIQFKSHCSVDSQNIETLIRDTLIQVAQDISEGIDSDSSLVDVRSCTVSRKLSSKIVGFVVSVLEELIVGLERGSVSRASIVQFMEDICPGEDYKDVEVDNLHKQLLKVMEDITKRKTASIYFHVIAEKFSAIKDHGETPKVPMSPEFQLLGNILTSVDANVLSQFVQATLLSVLSGVNKPTLIPGTVKPGSITSLLRVESSVIARKVVDDVIARVRRGISDGSFTLDDDLKRKTSMYIDDILGAIQKDIDEGTLKSDDNLKKIKERLQAKTKTSVEKIPATPPHTREPSRVNTSVASDSLSGKFSAYVLETLRSVVSDLRTRGQVSESGLFSGSETTSKKSSSLLDELIYKQIQSTIDSKHQVSSSSDKQFSSSSPKVSADSSQDLPTTSRDVSGIIDDVLNEAIAELIVDKVTKGAVDNMPTAKRSTSGSKSDVPASDVSSTDVSKYVLVTLKHVLSNENHSSSSLIGRDSSKETTSSQSKPSSVAVDTKVTEDTSKQETSVGVSDLAAEVIGQTIVNIQNKKLSNTEINILTELFPFDQQSGSTEEMLVEVLQGLKSDIINGAVSADSMQNIAHQLAALSVEKKSEPSDKDTSASVHSMVKEVISHIVVSFDEESQVVADSSMEVLPDVANKNGNKYVSPQPPTSQQSTEVISDLANLSLRDSPGGAGLQPDKLTARNSFRSVVQPESKDKITAASAGSIAIMDSDASLDTEVITIIKQSIPAVTNTSSTQCQVEKKTSKQITVTDSSTSSETVKNAKSDSKQKLVKKTSRPINPVKSKKSSLQNVKSKDKMSKTSVPAICVDSCSSVSNTSSRTKASSSSCSTSSSSSKEEPKQAVKKQDSKTTKSKTAAENDDTQSRTSVPSQTSSQPEVTQVKSVCGSHTTQVRVRDSQSEESKDESTTGHQ